MNLIPWRQKRRREQSGLRPASPLARLHDEMQALFDRFAELTAGWPAEFPLAGAPLLPMNVAATSSHVTVTLELPGVDPVDVDISVTGDLLTVRGEKKLDREEKKQDYHLVERQFGSFERTVRLPSTVNPDRIDATFKNGVLTISIEKRSDVAARKIKVRHA